MKLAGIISIFLGVIILTIFGFTDRLGNTELLIGASLILIGLVLYILLNRYSND